MPSAKQIKARKAFVKKYAKKGKKGSPKSKKSGGGVKNPSRSQLKAEEERKKPRLSGYAKMKRKMALRRELKKEMRY